MAKRRRLNRYTGTAGLVSRRSGGRQRNRHRPRRRRGDEPATKPRARNLHPRRMVHSRGAVDAVVRRPLRASRLVSASLLMTELALTRIFSVIMYYHFAFLAISIALLRHQRERRFRVRPASSPGSVGDRRSAAGDRVPRCTRSARSSRCFFSCGCASALNYSPDNLRLMLTIYALAALPFFTGGLVVTLADLAADRPDQRGLRGRSPGCGSRLPAPDSAARPARRARRGADRGGDGDLRPPSCSRPVSAAAAHARRRHRPLLARPRGTAVWPGRLRRRRHQGTQGRPRAVQQVELVLAHRRVRARARRLVAEPRLRRSASRHAVHGHRLGGLDTHPPAQRGPLERRVPAVRADRTRVPPAERRVFGRWSSVPAADATWRRRSSSAPARSMASRSTRSSPTT